MKKVNPKTKISEDDNLTSEIPINNGQNSNDENVNKNPAAQNEIKDNEEKSEENLKENIIFEDIYINEFKTPTGETIFCCKDKIVNSIKIEGLIVNDSSLDVFSERVSENYNEVFKENYKKCISPQQSQFANDCSKLLTGKFIENKPILIPAKAGFGKSTLIRTFLETKVLEMKEQDTDWGAIIVTDRIDDLKELQKHLENKFGPYGEYIYTDDKGIEEIGLIPWIYVLEGWSKSICLNKNIKQYDESNCSRGYCEYFGKCKISKQISEQIRSPIVAMSNARLFNYLSEDRLKDFVNWKNSLKENLERKVLIIDEKPKLENNDDIDIDIISEMIENAQKIPQFNEYMKNCKTQLIEELVLAQLKIVELQNRYLNYRNVIVYENNDSFFSEKFKAIWKNHYKFKHRYKMNSVETLLTKGGLWCNTEKRMYFKLLEYVNFDWNIGINTVIFDATAETDPSYKNVFNYFDIDDYKSYEHLNINVVNENLSKNAIKENPKKIAAITEWIKNDIVKKGKIFVISYKEYSAQVKQELQGLNNIVFDKKNCEEIIPYFGNTKGKNIWQDCNYMVQIGWNRYTSDDYLASYLSVYGFDKLREIYFNNVDDDKAKELLTIGYIKMVNNDFDEYNIVFHRLSKIVSDFEQEVFRTKLRDFGSDEDVTVYIFKPDERILDMIRQRFKGCEIKYIDVIELNVFKIENRKNNEDNKELALFKWLSTWDGKEKNLKELKQQLAISDDYWSKVKDTKLVKNVWKQRKIKQYRKGKQYFIGIVDDSGSD